MSAQHHDILHAIQSGPLTTRAIAEATGLPGLVVGYWLDRLRDDGRIVFHADTLRWGVALSEIAYISGGGYSINVTHRDQFHRRFLDESIRDASPLGPPGLGEDRGDDL